MTDKPLWRGRRFSNHKQASDDRAAWRLVQRHAPHLSETRCRAVIAAWLKSGLLYYDDYYDTKERTIKKGLFADVAKRALLPLPARSKGNLK
jgi:hypothetical protein